MLPDHGWERLELNYRIVSGSAMGSILVEVTPIHEPDERTNVFRSHYGP